ncbi:MLO-like protein 11 [Hibiscus syriacus]|uniref:MLO-like protein n=1 Tax=Hibiscus syriacus TaxID=106335 RepID=A0A6A3C2T7_HIBSY|nr:MLO-like protein 11 [Hibiscus syriacus]
MKEELMLLGFISLLLTATSRTIANICIPSRFYDGTFAPCTRSEIDEELEEESSDKRKLLIVFHLFRRMLNGVSRNTCTQGHEPFVSYEGLEQLHRFIFVMAITHVSYSCLTMLLAIVKIHSWRAWEDEAHKDRNDSLNEKARESILRRQTTFVMIHTSNPLTKNSLLIWVRCFFRQFGCSVGRADYLTLRKGFITNHNLTSKYDFHSYMIRSMEEEFQRIVGVRQGRPRTCATWAWAQGIIFKGGIILIFCLPVITSFASTRHDDAHFACKTESKIELFSVSGCSRSFTLFSDLLRVWMHFCFSGSCSGPLWGFVVAFMLFNIKGSNLYFWIAIIPITLVLLVGAKLQHVIATLAIENTGITGYFNGTKLRLRDELFWFKKPEWLLSLIHFILFQVVVYCNSVQVEDFLYISYSYCLSTHSSWLRSFGSGYCVDIFAVGYGFVIAHSSSFIDHSCTTLPLYALVTQMGTNYKAALIPERIRETIHGWGNAARRKRRHGRFIDDSTIHTDTSMVMSVEEDDHQLIDVHEAGDGTNTEIELQLPTTA